MILVVSTSLHPTSRSRLMARQATRYLAGLDRPHRQIDLAEYELPLCNGHDCYSHASAIELAGMIREARGILLATPVYNFDVSASAKNLVELTGNAWKDKVVGLRCAAGGRGSYMAPLGLANSLMLDFRCLVLPGFVFADESSFADGELQDDGVISRIERLTDQVSALAARWPIQGVPGAIPPS